jgi:Rrf2 family protein
MLVLAMRHDGGPVPAVEIAQDQDLSQKYLENLLASLKAAGLVVAERGKKGGYSLARPPEEISLYDVLERLEDSLGFVHCTGKEYGCERLQTCVTREIWQELRETTERILRNTTLDDLRRRQQALERKTGRSRSGARKAARRLPLASEP